ncbi:DNA helicase RecQ [Alphaproteobacteria bacterium]|nr:DNA helicase RecQ [Alphaproteobacteria bacterium]
MTFDSGDDLNNLLREVFGYSSFRPGQLEIIKTIVSSYNVLAVMPTGAGKSLCYQLPAIYSQQKTIIVSPLVALIDDQVAALSQSGVQVSKLHSGLSREENVEQWQQFASGVSKILYMSPERLMQRRMIEALQKQAIGMFVVDEAHCISKWGADFRPDYEELSKLKPLFPSAVISAFTATADKATRADIVDKLTNGDCSVFVKGFDRPNLALRVLPKQNIKGKLLDFLSDRCSQSGIIYCLSRNETDQTAEFLEGNGFNAISYHAGKTAEYRREAQNRFMTEDAVVMVATIAFGMGIDKPDIRYVVHASMPSSVEAFYQEIGRAGRDNAPAETLMFYGLQDIMKRQRMIFDGEGSEQHKLLEYKRLEALIGYCETTACRRLALLSYFDETDVSCGNCDNCLSPPVVQDYTEIAKLLITAVSETGQYFGVGHIIDVVRGSETAKVKARSHNQLNVFGLAADQSKQDLQSIIRQLIAADALKVNLEKYGALEVTNKGRYILEDKERFTAKVISKIASTARKQTSVLRTASSESNPQLLAELKKIRLTIARERSVPAFVIFSDKALFQMANEMPTTESDFLAISGVGKNKLQEFFEPFSQAIKLFGNRTVVSGQPNNSSSERAHDNSVLDDLIYSTPDGNYYKLEEQSSFTTLSPRVSEDFAENLQNIYRKRTENLAAGRMTNHGLPFSEEERDDLAKKFAEGHSIENLSEFYQRTVNAVETRLEQLGLFVREPLKDPPPDLERETAGGISCASCGDIIPEGRLEAMPNTRFCVHCKEDDENTSDIGVVFPPVPQDLVGDCPRCGEGIAVVYQNHTDKSFFVGCSSFPSCRWSKSMD